MTELKGHKVFLTGAGGGLGNGLALSFAQRGAILGITDIKQQDLDRTESDLAKQGFKCWTRRLDVTDPDAVNGAVSDFSGTGGGIDLVVNNAGLLTLARVVDLDLHDWQRVMQVNATGTFLVSQAVVRDMLKREREGSVVCISSVSGKVGDPELAHYCASKFAVIGFVQSLAQEVAESGITVNAVCPGIVDTPMVAKLGTGNRSISDFLQSQQIKRPQTPDEIARAIIFLHLSRSVTGQSLSVDGGTYFH